MRISDWSSDVCSSDLKVKEDGFNPKASLVWHLNDDILAYGLVSKGFRVGGIQTGLTKSFGRDAAPETFKSDTLWNYEAGIRTQFFHNTLRVDLTGFLVDWKNPQSLQQDASGLTVYRSEEHTSELQSLMRISYAVFCLKKKKKPDKQRNS